MRASSRFRRSVPWIAFLALLASLVTTGPAPGQQKTCTLRYVENGPVTRVFPYSVLGTIVDRRVWDLLYEPLNRRTTGETFQSVILDLHEARPEENGMVWVFPLRETKWHNGDPVTPDDIVRTFTELKRLAGEGLRGWTQEVIDLPKISEMSASGGDLRVRYTRAKTRESAQQSLHNFYIVPWKQHPNLDRLYGGRLNDFVYNDNAPRRGGVIGNGRWEAAPGAISSAGEITLLATDQFPGGRSPIDEIQGMYQPLVSERANMFRDGNVNVVLEIPFSQLNQLRTAIPEAQEIVHEANTFTSIIVSNRHPGLKDPRVREALVYAINRKEILQAMHSGRGYLLDAPFPPDTPCFSRAVQEHLREHSPERAKELLRAAGYKQNPNKRMIWAQGTIELDHLEFLLPSTIQGAEDQDVVNRVINSWEKNLGLRVELVERPPEEVRNLMDKGSYDFFLETQTVGSAWDVSMILLTNVPGQDANRHYLCSPQVERLLLEYRDSLGGDDRRQEEIGHQLHEAIAGSCDRIYLWSLERFGIFNPNEIEFAKSGTTLFENPALWRCR